MPINQSLRSMNPTDQDNLRRSLAYGQQVREEMFPKGVKAEGQTLRQDQRHDVEDSRWQVSQDNRAADKRESLTRYVKTQEEQESKRIQGEADKVAGKIFGHLDTLKKQVNEGMIPAQRYAAAWNNYTQNPPSRAALLKSSFDPETIKAEYDPAVALISPQERQRIEYQKQQEALQVNNAMAKSPFQMEADRINREKQVEDSRVKAQADEKNSLIYVSPGEGQSYQIMTKGDLAQYQKKEFSGKLPKVLTKEEAEKEVFYKNPGTGEWLSIKQVQVPDIQRVAINNGAQPFEIITPAQKVKIDEMTAKNHEQTQQVIAGVQLMQDSYALAAEKKDPLYDKSMQKIAAWASLDKEGSPTSRVGENGMRKIYDLYNSSEDPEISAYRKSQRKAFRILSSGERKDPESGKMIPLTPQIKARILAELKSDSTLDGNPSPYYIEAMKLEARRTLSEVEKKQKEDSKYKYSDEESAFSI